ncbi:Phthiocerol synthesis polyketide synthase type I PpsE [Actinomadura rubteroloni]|uniref:Phthiocerol synthesis polyketide synthase type I PpsE n=1 Tax=Actinomadura rubteroloni TaxID=1926885 RepID=A0A2P4UMW9_9ACTN|nr:beta-ketoacyl synthase N-terminal-like domain-containing protein [Actinomadura rubteroloni]POM26394.1 Phthiocerol synthesis polyketide synthase type I PpsE [Actinomadura rubteroloni]
MTVSDADIAIISMACRFPGADSVDRFWDLLREGGETLTRYTDEELLAAGVPAARLADPNFVKAGQDLTGIELFDADHFQITHDEAEILDPQQRIFLECALEALERAGYDPDRAEGHIGVYAGAGMNTYLLENLGDRYRTGTSVDRYRLMLANDKDFLATRVAYKLNLRGPGININTACSTSLVAVHTACLGLLGGECDLALAGAVHVGEPGRGHQYQEGMIFSPDGHCRAFDAAARGTVIGSGAGVVVLKRLKDALADGDWIHAVIKGSAVNNDGSNKTGYTAPSIAGQAEVIADAQEVADVEPLSIGYVEAHGTGTPLGDPIEVAALTRAFRQGDGDATGYCALGSVKTNIGHLDTAAGIAGLIKTALMLEHRTLVPSLHFTTPNPEIDFASSPFYVGTETADWPLPDASGVRRAGVSSFGIGGTNAHVILQEPPERVPAPAGDAADGRLLVLSARSEAALKQLAGALARHLRKNPGLDLAAVARTLGLGRRAHAHRLALVARDVRDAAMVLALGDGERQRRGVAADQPDGPVLVLTGARLSDEDDAELYRSVPAYRAAIDACAAHSAERGAFAHEYALASALIAWGVAPAALAATGTGAAVAAVLAGSRSLAEALTQAAGPPSEPRLPVYSPRTGRWMTAAEAGSPAAWTGDGDLSGLDALLDGSGLRPVRVAPDGPSGLAHLLLLCGEQWVHGARVDFAAVLEGAPAGRVPLPTYPFERRRYWIDPGDPRPAGPVAGDRLVDRFVPDDPERNRQLITDYVVDQIGQVLGGREHAALDTNLFELGLESLVLIEVAAKLSEQLDEPVPATAFVEFPTIRSFTGNLAELLGIAASGPPAAGAVRTSRRAMRAATRHDGGH